MFGFLAALLIAANTPAAEPLPTLPPTIGIVNVRAHCNDVERTVYHVLPVLMQNDAAINKSIVTLAKV
ncbi:MAG: hypothetical protein JOZ38_08305, partial [Candidatus Eremiobacteraeota bacterium]|nr:hypothetical protein [Candidatus Eremiobacteraeota bacterium]